MRKFKPRSLGFDDFSGQSTEPMGYSLGNSETLRRLQRNRQISTAKLPIDQQIKDFGSEEAWRNGYLNSGIANEKLAQITALQELQDWFGEQWIRSEESRTINVQFENLPSSKTQQYQQRLKSGPPKCRNEWEECFIRLYIGAEWAVEKWAKAAGLTCIDLNREDLYDPQDYVISGRRIDVKTTLSVGRRELRSHWSPNGASGEIICAVRSSSKSLNESGSGHYIQGIFCSAVYDIIPIHLKYFTVTSNLRNACYFHSPEIFFGVKGLTGPRVSALGADVTDYCLRNRRHLPALFKLNALDAGTMLRAALPECHLDLVPIATAVIDANMSHLLPHYLADYILTKIVSKRSVDVEAIKTVLWSVCEPLQDQKTYLSNLMELSCMLPHVRCAHHPDEGIGDIDIDLSSEKLIVKARCQSKPTLKTTILAYSWRTLETLIYGGAGIEICDAPGCGCLTHEHDGKRFGKRSCLKYGERGR